MINLVGRSGKEEIKIKVGTPYLVAPRTGCLLQYNLSNPFKLFNITLNILYKYIKFLNVNLSQNDIIY